MATRQNVLKGVKAARTYKVKKGAASTVKTTRKVRKDATERGPEKRRVFKRLDPYAYFIGKSLEEVDESIMEVLNLKAYPNYTLLTDVLRKMRAQVPMSLVETFFSLAKANGFQEAFDVISASREAEDMRRFLLERKATGIEAHGKAPRKAKVEASLPRRVQLIKYARQELAKRSIAELQELMNENNKRIRSGMTKTDLINALMTIGRETKTFEPVPFSTEFLSRCVINYRNVIWMRDIIKRAGKTLNIKGSVIGLGLQPDNKYATNFEVFPGSGWYRPKSSWFTHVCSEGRKYDDYKVAYVLKNGNDRSILLETKQMYDASLAMKEEKAPIGIGKAPVEVLKPVYGRDTKQEPILYDQRAKIVQDVKEASAQKELAPALFAQLRLFMSGQTTYCATCNANMLDPAFRSFHGGRQVLFCNQTCFDAYSFKRENCKNFVFTIGAGDVGQLGVERPDADNFKRVRESQGAVAVTCGGLHTLFLDKTGSVWSFGCNDEHALGRDVADCNAHIPDTVDIPGRVGAIAAGDSTSFALTVSGKIYMWGVFRDSNGQVGDVIQKPVKLKVDFEPVDISCGNNHLLVLSKDGSVYSIGVGEQGQLGRKIRGNATLRLKKIEAGNYKFDRIWAGSYCSFARSDGRIFVWGLNNYNQLGLEENDADFYQSVPVQSPSFNPNIKAISGGHYHTLALDESGQVYSLGRGWYGVLGLGDIDEGSTIVNATKIPRLKDCVSIACNANTSYAVDKFGKIWSWGMKTFQLGQRDVEQDLFEPRIISLKSKSKVLEIHAGGQHAAVIACVSPQNN